MNLQQLNIRNSIGPTRLSLSGNVFYAKISPLGAEKIKKLFCSKLDQLEEIFSIMVSPASK